MASKEKKIKFFTIEQTNHDTQEKVPASIIKDVLSYVSGLDKQDRRYKLTSFKVCFVDTITGPYNDMHSIVFKSASTDYKPPVMDQDTLEERKNPKKEREGDREKTHAVIRYTDDEVFLVLESNGNGIGIKAIMRYLRTFTRKYKHSIGERMDLALDHSIMGKDNFLDEIRSLQRVVIGKVYVEKAILGGNALNFSNRTQAVRHEITLDIKAKRDDSVLSTIEDIFNKMTAPGSRITKIRVEGKTANNGNTVVDTSFIEKLESVDADINSFTGVINTTSILTHLRDLANTL